MQLSYVYGDWMWRDYHLFDSTRIMFQIHDLRDEPLNEISDF